MTGERLLGEGVNVLDIASNESLHYGEYCFPYSPEHFTDSEREILQGRFTNWDKPVYAMIVDDQEVAGALLSRFSRAKASPRQIYLKEFYGDPSEGIKIIADYLMKERGYEEEGASEFAAEFYRKTMEAHQKVQEKGRIRKKAFYARTLADYGDDSVIQMGSVHLIFEGVSQIAAKAIEDNRIGAAYIEKSTRYVEFDKQVNGRFLYMNVPEFAGSPFGERFDEWSNACFEGYKRSITPTKEFLRQKYPIESVSFFDKVSERDISFSEVTDDETRAILTKAYENALRAKALDLVRVFLPTTTVTNLGAHFSGQAAEHAINKMLASPHQEVQMIGLMALEEAYKVIPSFLERVPGKYGEVEREYLRQGRTRGREVFEKWQKYFREGSDRENKGKHDVRLFSFDTNTDVLIATHLLYAHGDPDDHALKVFDWALRVKKEDLQANPGFWWSPRLGEIIKDGVPNRDLTGRNRRHKLPRAFEYGDFTVEFRTNFGIYRDLQRNRLMTIERQRLTAEEVDVPKEFQEPGMESVLSDYISVAAETRDLHNELMSSDNEDLASAAEYVTILGNKMGYIIQANARQWAFFSELRTIEGGHRDYRWAMQKAVRQILYVAPYLKPLFAHVNWKKDFGLGRLRAEIKKEQKLATL